MPTYTELHNSFVQLKEMKLISPSSPNRYVVTFDVFEITDPTTLVTDKYFEAGASLEGTELLYEELSAVVIKQSAGTYKLGA